MCLSIKLSQTHIGSPDLAFLCGYLFIMPFFFFYILLLQQHNLSVIKRKNQKHIC